MSESINPVNPNLAGLNLAQPLVDAVRLAFRSLQTVQNNLDELNAAVVRAQTAADSAGVAAAAPHPSAQAVVTGSRALGTAYHNTGKTAMYVLVTLSCTSSGGANFGQANALTDSAATPTTVVASTFNGSTTATVYEHLGFWVLPGNYYKVVVTNTTVTLVAWTEWS